MERQDWIYSSLLILFPSVAYANGGGPLLLLISGSAFIIGQIWILFVETMLFKRMSGLTLKISFKQVFLANLVSTVVVGLGFPLLLAVLTMVFSIWLAQPYSGYAFALGTWVYDQSPHRAYIGYISLAWLFITFLLTVFCEKAFYRWYWNKTHFNANFSINQFIWRAHLISYAGLLIFVIVLWQDVFDL